MVGDRLELRCSNSWAAQTIDRPDVLEIMSRKASAMLGRPVKAIVVDLNATPKGNPRMEQLMNFGRANPNIVNIKNNG